MAGSRLISSSSRAGSFRVQGTLGELQRGSFTVGTRVKILSRTNDDSWTGTITTIDYENPTQNNSNNYYISDSSSSSMNSSSRYPFYVELDSTDGLILGQHVYLALDSGEDLTGLRLSSAFVAFNDDGSTYVWAEKNGKLEKRTVTLGEYDAMTDTYAVTDGLSESDYVAYPDENCVEGAATTREKPARDHPGGRHEQRHEQRCGHRHDKRRHRGGLNGHSGIKGHL